MPTTVAAVKRDLGSLSSNLSDGDIQAIIDANGGIHALSVAHCLDVIAASTLAKGSIAIGKYREDNVSASSSIYALAAIWRRRYKGAGFAGGISKADKLARELSTDRESGSVKVRMFDKNGTD